MTEMTRVKKFAKYREQIANMKPEDFPKDNHPDYVPKHAALAPGWVWAIRWEGFNGLVHYSFDCFPTKDAAQAKADKDKDSFPGTFDIVKMPFEEFLKVA